MLVLDIIKFKLLPTYNYVQFLFSKEGELLRDFNKRFKES